MKEMDEWKLKAERYRKELQDSGISHPITPHLFDSRPPESAMDTLRTEYRNVKSTNENLHAELSQLRRSISTIDTAKRTALENLLNKESEVDQLNGKQSSVYLKPFNSLT
jgi:chromosome segregation ATPase